jgi:rare lipoprotein A
VPKAERRVCGASAVAALCLAVALAACGSVRPRPGGYYLDDGPGANPPAGLDRVPDAVPRAEPINRFASRPYTVLGRTYTPYTELRPYRARGRASWYGRRYHGQRTSLGEIYDMYSMSGAHTLLPLPSYARVTNLENGRSVVVRINDRGPFREDRIVDLSYAAAHRLGFLNRGSALVEVEAIVPGQEQPVSSVAAVTAIAPAPMPITGDAAGVFVQLGAFASPENAAAFARRVRADLSWLRNAPVVHRQGALYKVRTGPYADRESAERDAARMRRALGFSPFLTNP